MQVDEKTDDKDDESGMWEETFKSHSDSKPNGTSTTLYISLALLC